MRRWNPRWPVQSGPRIELPFRDMKSSFQNSLQAPVGHSGFGLDADPTCPGSATVKTMATRLEIAHGAVVIAAITSCTNTSNPSVMIAAGLLAKKAAEQGLTVPSLCENQFRPRFPGRNRLPRQIRFDGIAGKTRFSHRRLRLHFVHRQQWSAAGTGVRSHHRQANWSHRAS